MTTLSSPNQAPSTIERWQHARDRSPARGASDSRAAPGARFSIAMVTDSTEPYPEVVHAMALAEALAACGHRVTLWAPGPPGVTEFHRRPEAGVATRVVPVRSLGSTNRSAHLRSCIRRLRESFDPAFFDVVHAHGWVGAAALGPCVRTVHRVERPGAAELSDRHDNALRTATGHVCNSPAVAAELRTGWGIKAALIPDGVDSARFTAGAAPGPVAVAGRERWRRDLGDYVLTVCDELSGETTHDILSALADPSAAGRRVVIAQPPRTTGGRAADDCWRRASAGTGVAVVRPERLGPHLPALVAAARAFVAPTGIGWPHPGVLQALAAQVPVLLHGPSPGPAVLQPVTRHTRDRAELTAALAATTDESSAAQRAAGAALAAQHSWAHTARAHQQLYLADSAQRATATH